MVAFSQAQRDIVRLAITQFDVNESSGSWAVTKAEFDTIITDIDAFVDGEVPTNLNAAITTSLQGNLTDAQELRVFAQCVQTRFDEGV